MRGNYWVGGIIGYLSDNTLKLVLTTLHSISTKTVVMEIFFSNVVFKYRLEK